MNVKNNIPRDILYQLEPNGEHSYIGIIDDAFHVKYMEFLYNWLEKMDDFKKVLESIDIVISGIKHSSSRTQTEEFLMLLEKVVSRNKEKIIHEKALNFLLADFGKLYQQVEIRPQVFQLVGNLKMELL